MKILWVVLGLLVALSVGGYAAWTVFSAPQYSHAIVEVPGAAAHTTPLTMCYIPRGKFHMGSPENEKDRGADEARHKVTLTSPFWIGKHEVTNAQFEAFVKETGYKTEAEKDGWSVSLHLMAFTNIEGVTYKNPGLFSQHPDCPVVRVSWNDARAYCAWLSEKTGWKFRLPTEAEWEYACRAGTNTAQFTGDSDDSLSGYANGMDASFSKHVFVEWAFFKWDDGHPFPAPVGSFQPNPWGLHDMIGNVCEWCEDWHGDYPSGDASDPTGPVTGSERVYRGGAWCSGPGYCRAADRTSVTPSFRSVFLGFRLAASPAVR